MRLFLNANTMRTLLYETFLKFTLLETIEHIHTHVLFHWIKKYARMRIIWQPMAEVICLSSFQALIFQHVDCNDINRENPHSYTYIPQHYDQSVKVDLKMKVAFRDPIIRHPRSHYTFVWQTSLKTSENYLPNTFKDCCYLLAAATAAYASVITVLSPSY